MHCKISFKLAIFAAAIVTWSIAAGATQPSLLPVASSSFTDGAKMPSKLTCDGADLSPQIRFLSPPTGTKSFVIMMDDPDAPVAFTHWLAYGIPADTRELAEGASTPSHRLDHAAEGTNSFGHVGYGGPCPPEGKPHHYALQVYALDVMPALPVGAQADQVNAAIHGHVLAEGRITGLYARGGG
jgi:Raf kinase inhibitor-like YbhB/YbcL family protein